MMIFELVSRKHAETRARSELSETFERAEDLHARGPGRQDGKMVRFKRSKSFHGMRPRRLSGYLRVSLGGPASGEQLRGKKKK